MSVGDTVSIDIGANAEAHKIAKIGTAASNHTTVWQPLPDGPVITISPGSSNVPVMSTSGMEVGEKIALGYGATDPAVARDVERYEVVTVTAVGKPGTQAYLADDVSAGATNIKVTEVKNISVGDKIRLDIDSVGHGIETLTVKHGGTEAVKTNLAADAGVGATSIKMRRTEGIKVGDKITVGTPATREVVTVSAVESAGRGEASIEVTPALANAHIRDEWVVSPGTGLDLEAPLKFAHAANLPFSDRGTGITFTPATTFAHSSNEPVLSLGSGITLDGSLGKAHAIYAAVRDASVTTAGYQGNPQPDQWFGGPELSTDYPLFGRTVNIKEGSMVLRDAAGVVVDSINYGALVDPWAAEGYQANLGSRRSGCSVPIAGSTAGFGPAAILTNTSAGRFPDGTDADSNCTDFLTQAAATLPIASAVGATNIKVTSVEGFEAGEKIYIDDGTRRETASIATVGTAGATTLSEPTNVDATVIPVASALGFRDGETITIGAGEDADTAVVSAIRRFGPASITVKAPLLHAHANGTEVAGSGITLTSALSQAHEKGAPVADNLPTPGTANQYRRKGN